jgi:hypothetical protein
MLCSQVDCVKVVEKSPEHGKKWYGYREKENENWGLSKPEEVNIGPGP